MGYSRKNPHPHNGRHAEKFSQEGGLTALEIQTGGVLERKDTSSGVTFDFTDVSIPSMFFYQLLIKKNCFVFSCFIILSNYRPLTTFILSFHP